MNPIIEQKINCESCANLNRRRLHCRVLDHPIENTYAARSHAATCGGYKLLVPRIGVVQKLSNWWKRFDAWICESGNTRVMP